MLILRSFCKLTKESFGFYGLTSWEKIYLDCPVSVLRGAKYINIYQKQVNAARSFVWQRMRYNEHWKLNLSISDSLDETGGRKPMVQARETFLTVFSILQTKFMIYLKFWREWKFRHELIDI